MIKISSCILLKNSIIDIEKTTAHKVGCLVYKGKNPPATRQSIGAVFLCLDLFLSIVNIRKQCHKKHSKEHKVLKKDKR